MRGAAALLAVFACGGGLAAEPAAVAAQELKAAVELFVNARTAGSIDDFLVAAAKVKALLLKRILFALAVLPLRAPELPRPVGVERRPVRTGYGPALRGRPRIPEILYRIPYAPREAFWKPEHPEIRGSKLCPGVSCDARCSGVPLRSGAP